MVLAKYDESCESAKLRDSGEFGDSVGGLGADLSFYSWLVGWLENLRGPRGRLLLGGDEVTTHHL